jgi:hypothetical protein
MGPLQGVACSGGPRLRLAGAGVACCNPVWQMLVRRPSATTSDQNYGAGVEVRDVYYNGRLVHPPRQAYPC